MQQTTNRSIWDELKMSFEILQTAVHLATYFRIYVKHWNTFAHQSQRRHINDIRTRQTLLQHTCAPPFMHVLHDMIHIHIYLINFDLRRFTSVPNVRHAMPCHRMSLYALALSQPEEEKKNQWIWNRKLGRTVKLKYLKWFECQMVWSVGYIPLGNPTRESTYQPINLK